MSEFKEVFEQLETESKLDRRDFLRNSLLAGLAIGPLANLFQSVVAQAADIEITVYGDDPAELERELSKRQAKAAAQFARDLGMAAVGLGGVWIGVGGSAAGPTAGLAVILVIEGMVMVIEGIGFLYLAFVLDMVAADPPRSNYKIDKLLEGPFYASRILEQSTDAVLNESLLNANELVVAARRLWDSLELWQGAQLAQDREWMNTHAENFWSSFEQFQTSFALVPDHISSILDLLKDPTAQPSYQEVVDASKQFAGRSVLDIPNVRQVLEQGINWNSPIFDGFRDSLRSQLRNVTIQPFDESAFGRLLEDWRDSARYFASV